VDGSGQDHGFLRSGTQFLSFDFPGAFYTLPFSLNASGDVVGGYGTQISQQHGFLLEGSKGVTFDFPDSIGTEGKGINARGQITGNYFAPDGQPYHGFIATPTDEQP